MFRSLTTFLLSIVSLSVFATHNIGGEITYRLISDTSLTYEITIKTWTEALSLAGRDSLQLQIVDCNSLFPIDYMWVLRGSVDTLPMHPDILINWYRVESCTFDSVGCYLLCMTDPNREDDILNIENSVNVPMAFTSTMEVGGNLQGFLNSSPLMNAPGVVYRRPYQKMTYDPLLTDADGDSLVVRIVTPARGCGVPVNGYYDLDDPKFASPGYPNQMNFDPITGEIEWNMPTIEGSYQVALLVDEYRNYLYLGSVYRDVQIRITSDTSIQVGIPDDPNFQVQIWPNPTTDMVTIASTTLVDHVTVIDLSGRVRFESNVSKLQRSVDVARWPDGIYLIKWKSCNGESGTQKLLKISR